MIAPNAFQVVVEALGHRMQTLLVREVTPGRSFAFKGKKSLCPASSLTGIYASRRRRSWNLEPFAAQPSSGMGFMSGGGFQGLLGGIMGFGWRQQPV